MDREKESPPERLPFCLDDTVGEIVRASQECPGVYYIAARKQDGKFLADEYYVVEKSSPAISKEAMAYGRMPEEDSRVLLYPFADMASAGWIATTTNYLWPLWGVLVIGMVLKQLRCGRKVPVWEVAAALLACAYAGSQEQAAVLLLLLLGMEVLHYISEKRMKQPLLYALCGIDIISLI